MPSSLAKGVGPASSMGVCGGVMSGRGLKRLGCNSAGFEGGFGADMTLDRRFERVSGEGRAVALPGSVK